VSGFGPVSGVELVGGLIVVEDPSPTDTDALLWFALGGDPVLESLRRRGAAPLEELAGGDFALPPPVPLPLEVAFSHRCFLLLLSALTKFRLLPVEVAPGAFDGAAKGLDTPPPAAPGDVAFLFVEAAEP